MEIGTDARENAARLKPRWDALCGELGVSTEARDHWWALLERRHCEKQRAYHTLQHLCELFAYLDEHRSRIRDHSAVALAIFFHDAIYNPKAGSPKNEQDSAVLFDTFGQEALPPGDPPGLAKGQLIAKVRGWIVQTASHKVSESDEEDCKLFMDFDMAILGSSQERYDVYAKQIMQEYSHVPEAIFCKARSDFLASTAFAGTPIFASEVFKASHETAARENMAREAAALADRFQRCGALSRFSAHLILGAKAAASWRPARRAGKGSVIVAAVAVTALKPLLAAGAAALVGGAAGTLALRLVFGTRFVRYPYPEPRARSGTVLLAGSYNPPHNGHLEMLRYLSQAHEKVVAVIGVNPNKKYDVNPYQRQELLRAMVKEAGLANVEVVVWTSIIFLYGRTIGAHCMYRGIRTWREDGLGEKYLELQNLLYQLVFGYWPIPTAYLQGAPALVGVSSTLLRKRLAAGRGIEDLVPQACAAAVQQAYEHTGPK